MNCYPIKGMRALLLGLLLIMAACGESAQPCDVSVEMTELLRLHNQARATSRRCGAQIFPSTAALLWHCDLHNAAASHAHDMARGDFLSHRGSDRSSFTDRINRVDFDWQASAENIGQGYRSASQATNALLPSPQHCANIMNSDYLYFGAERNGDYWAMLFAK